MSEGASPSKEKGEGWAGVVNVVPTIYYDLIARIIPGMGFLFVIAAALPSAESAAHRSPLIEAVFEVKKISTEHIFVLLVLSYLAGMVLTGASLVWDAFSFLIIRLLGLGKNLGLSSWDFKKEWASVAESMERTIRASESAGGIVTKALAELALCQNLLSGCLVLAALGSIGDADRLAPSFVQYRLAYCTIFAALLVSMLFRYLMFLGRLKILDKLYCDQEHRELLIGRVVHQLVGHADLPAETLNVWLDSGLEDARDRQLFDLPPRIGPSASEKLF